MSVDVAGPPPAHAPRFDAPIEDLDEDLPEEIEEEFDEEFDKVVDDDEAAEKASRSARAPRAPREDRPERAGEDEGGARRRRRRRGRRGRNRVEGEAPLADEEASESAGDEMTPSEDAGDEPTETFAGEQPVAADGEGRRRRGRRGRRGGRRVDGDRVEAAAFADASGEEDDVEATPEAPVIEADAGDVPGSGTILIDSDETIAEAPKKGRRRPKARTTPAESARVVEAEAEPVAAKPKRARRPKAEPVEVEASVEMAPLDVSTVDEAPASEEVAPKPRRRAPRRKADAAEVPATEPATDAATGEPLAATENSAIPLADGDTGESVEGELSADGIDPDPGEAGSARRGWWQRTFGA